MGTSVSLPRTIFNLVLPNVMQDRLVATHVIPELLGDLISLGTSAYQKSAGSTTQQTENSPGGSWTVWRRIS